LLLTILFLFFTGPHIPVSSALEKADSLIAIGKVSNATEILAGIKPALLDPIQRANHAKLLGEAYRLQGNTHHSIEILNRGLKDLPYDSSNKLVCQLYNELSKTARAGFRSEKAAQYGLKAISLAMDLGDENLIYKSYTILGNAYYDIPNLDSALICYQEAEKYLKVDDFRAKAILNNNVGNLLIETRRFSEAENILKKASQLFIQDGDLRNGNKSLTAYASSMQSQGKYIEALKILEEVLDEAQKNNWTEDKLTIWNQQLEILLAQRKIPFYRSLRDSIAIAEHQLMNKSILEAQEKYENVRLESQLTTERQQRDIARLESEKRSNIIRFLSLGLVALLLFGGFYFYNQRLKNKLRLSEEALNKTKALEAERTRIAGEMHDDLGGGLTTIRFLSQSVLGKLEDTKEKQKLEKIASHAEDLVGNMSEIIWAMNAGFDTLESLIAYTRRFGAEYFSDYAIAFDFKVKGQAKNYPMTGEQRRNVFLIIKEAFHNITKHAEADSVQVVFELVNTSTLNIRIADNGIGFSGKANAIGSGMQTIEKRTAKVDGEISFESNGGTCINLKLPVTKKELPIT